MERTARILVTGGSGMVGRALIGRLRRDGHQHLSAPSSHALDLRDQAATHRFFADNPVDFVFHLAGHIGGIGASITYPVEFLYENTMIAMHVIHAARVAGVRKLLFLGSSCVYPRDCPQPMSEDDVLTGAFEPTNEGYAIAKIAGMKLCEYSNRQYGTNFISLMPCNVYGYGDHFEPERSHVGLGADLQVRSGQAAEAARGRGVGHRHHAGASCCSSRTSPTPCSISCDNVDARDIGSFVNIGLGRDISIRDLAYLIKDIVGYPGEIVFDAGKPDGMPRKLMNVERAAQLGWTAQVGIPEGLRLTYDWYLKNVAVEMGVE